MFQLTAEEAENLRFQIGTSKKQRGGRRYLPYAFTEHGVAMRRFIASNAQVFQRLDALEIKQLKTDTKMDKVLNAIESKEIQPKQGIFFDGQIFDAYKFVSDLIRRAKKSIIIIDNYIDDSVLLLLTKRKKKL